LIIGRTQQIDIEFYCSHTASQFSACRLR
jgi:hypothetical protein